jgi:hypothetical protein
MNLFQIDLLFPLPVHTYLLTCDLPGSLNFEKFEIKVENSPLTNSEKVDFRSRLCFPPIFP